MGRGGARDAIAASEAALELRERFGADVSLVAVELHSDDRGTLTAVDHGVLPFVVRRMFVITGVPPGTARGGHRHVRGVQALICLGGCIEVQLSRGAVSFEVALVADGVGLLIAAGVWSQQRYVEEGSEMLVLASEPYDPASYDSNPG